MFWMQVAAGAVSTLPVAVSRYRSAGMSAAIASLARAENFDRMVCDFIFPAVNIPDLSRWIIFQHNVETIIWRRHAASASGIRKWYMGLQAARMLDFERRSCRAAAHVIAVSPVDADLMKSMFQIPHVSEIPTGVDIEGFCPPASSPQVADLVFVGAMDWLPNIDGVLYFVREILPLIRKHKPDCSLAIVGRTPAPEISALASDPLIRVTGTVPDVRPYFWGSSISIVPLRIGGGTRLKIYEAMAAKIPVVSTATGAEGLAVSCPENIRLADTPEDFGQECLALLDDANERGRMAAAGWTLVSSNFSWDRVAASFEAIVGGVSP
jgi:glycosyltransferase involved in cell wall biosynthesis